MGCCITKDEQPLLDIEEPYYVLDSPDVLIVSHNTPINRSPSPYLFDHDNIMI